MAPTLRPREGGKAKPPRAREAAGEDPADLAAARKKLRAKAEAGGGAPANHYNVPSNVPPDAPVKRVDVLDLEDLAAKGCAGQPSVLCRCFASEKFPHCDGAHARHNAETGDNAGPVILACGVPAEAQAVDGALLAAGTPAGDLPAVALDAEELAKAAPRRANNYGVASTMPPDAKTKRVDKLDLDVLLERARVTGAPVTLCRCYKSKCFPMCDGSHQKHNAETGDNVGPLVLKPMGGGRAAAPAAPAAPAKLTLLPDKDLPVVAMAEVLKHNRPGDFWTVIHGRVYDLSAFLPKHPGGDQVLLAAHPVADHEFDAAHPGAEKGVIDRHLDRAQLLGRVDPAEVRKTLEAQKAREAPEEPPRPRVHGDGGAYVGGDWVDLEDCAEHFNVAGGSGGCAGCTQPCAPRSRSRRPAAKADGSYDVVVVGAGAIGSAIARELAKTTAHVLVVDAADDVTQGATKGNSVIVHAGYDDKPGSVRAKYCWTGNQMFPQLDRELHFGYQKNGSLVIAKSTEDEATLRELLARGEKNGVQNLRIVGREELRRMEPHVHPDARAALHSPDAGTLTPYEYTIALAENAADNGVEFRLRREVVGVERCPTGPRFKLRVKHWEPPAAARHLRAAGAPAAAGRATYLAAAAVALLYRAFAVLVARLQLRPRREETWRFRPSPGTELGGEAVDEEIRCDFVVNAAGCASDKVAAMVGDRSFTVKPRMGEYILLHKREGYKATHTLFPAPHPVYGKGVLVQTTLWGNLILGPTARDTLVADAAGGYKVNEAVRDEKAENILGYVLNKCRELVPSFDPKSVIHTFSGARAKSSTGEWVIGPVDGVPGFLNAASIDSPGIAASPAIAEDVVRMLREAGARLEPDASFNPVRAPLIRPKDGWAGLTLTPDPAKMFDEPDPTKNVVCKCEKVTEAEVVAACRRSLPVDSTQAIRKRTRAGMGGCQAKPANYDCEARVAAIVARELGVPLAEVGRRPWPASSLLGKRFVDDADRARMEALAARGGWTLAGAAK